MCACVLSVIAGHVIEEERNTEQGVEFLVTTRENWQDSLLGIHLTWHLTLYYLGRWQYNQWTVLLDLVEIARL